MDAKRLDVIERVLLGVDCAVTDKLIGELIAAAREAVRMRTTALKRIAEIDADERFHYPTATVFENAPLAMIQACMETEVYILARLTNVAPPKKGPRKPARAALGSKP